MAVWTSGIILKSLGHADTEIAMVTGTIGIAWSAKPIAAPFLEIVRTKRSLVLALEVAVALALAGLALAIGLGGSLPLIVAALWVMALSSAAHDVCADGIYVTALGRKRQALWIPALTVSPAIARVLATAGVVALGGTLIGAGYAASTVWMGAVGAGAVVMAALAAYHALVLPTGSLTRHPENSGEAARALRATVVSFFRKKSIGGMLGVVALLRLGEGLLASESEMFMKVKPGDGGLGMTLSDLGLMGSVTGIPKLGGTVLGGVLVARFGLRHMMVFLALGACAPQLCCLLLSLATSPDHPLSPFTGAVVMSLGGLGQAFGSVAIPIYLMQQVAPGERAMSHYAFAVTIAALVMVPSQALSGLLADTMGYRTFFVVVLMASIPGVIAARKAPFPDDTAGSTTG
jgi:PAT family beta-lactamase induction signal transducer AmpG